MGKFFGKIGFAHTVEVVPGRHEEVFEERNYYGDIIKVNRRLENASQINDNINISNQFSIVADAYASENFFAMRYVEWMGSLWQISSVDVQRPRLILTIGGVYNK